MLVPKNGLAVQNTVPSSSVESLQLLCMDQSNKPRAPFKLKTVHGSCDRHAESMKRQGLSLLVACLAKT